MTNCNPVVSIIIPARLDSPEKLSFFNEALASADTQSYMKPFEIVVCLDGSELPDPPRTNTTIRWVFHKQARGAGAARNTAAAAAHGTYLLPLDADDVLVVDALETLIEHADPGLFVYGDVELFGERGGVFRLPPYQQHEMLRLTGLAPVTALFSRDAWLKAGGWDETLTALEDVDFYLRLIEAGYSGLHIDQVTLKYRKHVNSRQAAAESGKDVLRTIQETIRDNHKSLYNRDVNMPDKPCSTCPGQGTVATGVSMPDPTLQNPQELRYEGLMQGSFDVRSHRDASVSYHIDGKGSTFFVDERDLAQFVNNTVHGFPEYKNLTVLQKQYPPKAEQRVQATSSAALNIPPLPHLPQLETLNFTQAKAAIDKVTDAADLRALYAEENALPEPRKTVLAHIQKKLTALESETI